MTIVESFPRGYSWLTPLHIHINGATVTQLRLMAGDIYIACSKRQ